MGLGWPLGNVKWPAGMKVLEFRPTTWASPLCLVKSIAWPESLTQLDLGNDFNQPLNETTWPRTLTKLRLGTSFIASRSDISKRTAQHDVQSEADHPGNVVR